MRQVHLTTLDGHARIVHSNDTSPERTSFRLALQAASAPIPCCLAALVPGAPNALSVAIFLSGLVYAYWIIRRTNTEAEQIDAHHEAALTHATETSRIEIRERESRLPKRGAWRATEKGAVLEEELDEEPDRSIGDHLITAADARFVYDLALGFQSFARNRFLPAFTQRLAMPSGRVLTRDNFDSIIAWLLADEAIERDVGSTSYRPRGGWACPPAAITEAREET